MLRLASQGKPLRVVDDQICAPSYTVDVAEATIALLTAGVSGLYHVTNAAACSWHEFAQTLFKLAEARADLEPIPSSVYGAPARRPRYSVLNNAGLRGLGLAQPRPWREALAAYLLERKHKT